MAKYSLNDGAVAKARELIDARQYVLDSDWGDVQPRADDQNSYLESHSWEDYAQWHLGLTEGATDGTKARYAFVYGDLGGSHRTGLIASFGSTGASRHGGARTKTSRHRGATARCCGSIPRCVEDSRGWAAGR